MKPQYPVRNPVSPQNPKLLIFFNIKIIYFVHTSDE